MTLKEILANIRRLAPNTIAAAAIYQYRKTWTEARWQDPEHPKRGLKLWYSFRHKLHLSGHHKWPKHWNSHGRVRYIQPTARGATLLTDYGSIEIVFLTDDLIRVRHHPHNREETKEPIPYAIAKPVEAWEVPVISHIQTEKVFYLKTQALTVGIILDSAVVFYADPKGNLLRVDVDASWSPMGAVRHRTALANGEFIFGLGERATPWNRRGRKHILWNTEAAGYTTNDDPLYINIPVYVGLLANEGAHQGRTSESNGHSYLVFYENPTYAEFDLAASKVGVADHRFAGGELRYYFAAGSVPHLMERYTALTGRHNLPPMWLLGYHQSRWSYYPEARVRKLARDLQEHNIPCDAIHLDIDYMDGFRIFTCDEERFPNLPQLADDLRNQGIKLITIIDPGVKRDPDYEIYKSGLKGEHFCTTPDGKVFHAPVWPGLCGFPDFTDPRTRAWWGNLYRPLVEAGIAGFWNDMNEPSAFTQSKERTLPNTLQHALEGRGGDHREAHNVYGMQMVRASNEGLNKLQPHKRPVIITRSGWAGVQRYATSWTGDNASTWESLRLTVPMVLGLGLSGLGFTGPDVGGFVGKADGELFTRWLQMAAFIPFFRAHTASGTPDQEPWSYGEPYLSIARRFIELRYELLPYFYTAAWQMATRGWPMVRPIWWFDQNNTALWSVDDAFLCGDALLVAPIGEAGAKSREVTLPTGGWYDFWSNRLRYGSITFEQFAPLELLPLYVREGTVLPMGEAGPSVEQRNEKFLRLSVYPLSEQGATTTEFYEDAGEGRCYQQGAYRLSQFVLKQSDNHLTISWKRKGSFEPPYEHLELTLNGLKRAPRVVRADGDQFEVVATDPVRRTALLGVPLFKELEITL